MSFHKWRSPSQLWRKLKPKAREFRADSTLAESVLWDMLRARRLNGLKFRRQHAIGQYIADFCCPKIRLVVEVDGGVHEPRSLEDEFRETELRTRGFTVLRLKNEEVLRDGGRILAKIAEAAQRHT